MPHDALLRESSDVVRQLRRVETAATPRTARLFACGCARLAWALLDDATARRAVVLAEEYADGRVTAGEFRAAAADARWARKTAPRSDPEDKRRHRALTAVYYASHSGAKSGSVFGHAVAALEALPVDLRDAGGPGLVRCVFGAPRAVSHPRWLDPVVTGMATEIYATRAWDRLPELADALVAAGFYFAPLVDHLRAGGPHTRGCWALDLLLGRA